MRAGTAEGSDVMDVLVVDADAATRSVVRHVLEREDLQVLEVCSGAAALELHRRQPVDLVLLELNLPDMPGLDVLDELRATDPTIAVIMLTASGSEAETVHGLVSGADDYIVKPFSVRELAARVLALGRRVGGGRSGVLEFDRLSIDTEAREVTRDSQRIKLTPVELDLLVHLARNPRVTFTRDQLLHAVWRSSAAWQDAATVTEHIRRLRTKLEHDPLEPELLVTVRGVGYRFEPGPALHNGVPLRSGH